MALCKAYISLAVVISAASANFHYQHYKTFSFHGNAHGDTHQKPWFFTDYTNPYSQASSEVVPNYEEHNQGGYVGQEAGQHAHYENPTEALFAASTKKVPQEDKNFKKAISPFYTITDKDNEKYKELVLKSGVPFCQEIKTVPATGNKRHRRNAMTCYKCKDPKNGATYEHCSYVSQPQATSRLDKYVEIPSNFRYRRSNANAESANVEEKHQQLPITGIDGKLSEPFMFGEEFFTPEATDEMPVEYKKQVENCEKVIKDSMICMICKDPKTNGKYEQCSYIAQPNEKAYSYIKSSSFGNPQTLEKPDKAEKTSSTKNNNYETHGGAQSSSPRAGESSTENAGYSSPSAAQEEKRTYPGNDYYDYSANNQQSHKKDDDEGSAESASTAGCTKVVKDSMTCTICKDPKTGGNYEQCSYSHKPNDKVYQFTRSKTFAFPHAENDGKNKPEESRTAPSKSSAYSDDTPSYEGYGSHKESSEKPSSNYKRGGSNSGYDSYDSDLYGPSSQEYVQSESEKIAAKTKKGNDCKEVTKDSMTCTVCTDPKTGGNFEQCSYAYKPKDKVFSFTKAASFGSPTDTGDKNSYAEGESSPHTSYIPSFSDVSGYGFTTDDKPYVAENTEDKPKRSEQLTSNNEEKQNAAEKSSEHSIPGYYDTALKKAEIEKYMQEFQKEDRSKCKKIMRDQMTCYQCTDENNFQKEECMFVAAPQASNNKLTYQEVKEFKMDPIKEDVKADTSKKTEAKYDRPEVVHEEPSVSASRRHVKREQPDHDEDDSDDEKEDVKEEDNEEEEEEQKEADPYDYKAVTKPRSLENSS
ncbi:uncharacterized protein LOC107265526 isoform X2 [Cephus cinctus]|uniref:Uncharacterized protein LOC107265526 isoform X2 n=1 Tax=Cephus cinctus TaxID=211228 RepID=A0AAJ7VZ47_CEPCN|nr:uncharacterized protein LOC107265526 isoform X2 [Cephus cinctus]